MSFMIPLAEAAARTAVKAGSNGRFGAFMLGRAMGKSSAANGNGNAGANNYNLHVNVPSSVGTSVTE